MLNACCGLITHDLFVVLEVLETSLESMFEIKYLMDAYI